MTDQIRYCALDLELNCPERGAESVGPPKIIQVGISVGLWPSCSILYTGAQYVKIEEEIYPRITELTGISNNDIQQYGKSHSEIKAWLSEIKEEYKLYSNPITWGHSDLDELRAEMESETNEPFNLMGRRPIDVKTIFTFKQIVNHKASKLGLKGALGRYGLGFQGTPHRADVDAMNTLRLFFHMLHLDSQIQYHLVTANALLTDRL